MADKQMIIYCDDTRDLIEIIAGLVREGLTFEAHMVSRGGDWKIVLTGGF